MSQGLGPGWYHGEGDPAGTVRYWDGEAWTSDPVPDPSGPTTPSTPSYGAPNFGTGVSVSTYATWWQRVAATLLDGLVIFAAAIPAAILAAVLIAINETLGAIVAIILYLVVLIAAVYLLSWAQGTTGQTPGKRLMGIQVVRDGSGEFMGGGLGLGRYLLSFINSLPLYLGWLWPLWDAKNQTLVDKMLGTVVVPTDRPKKLFPLFPGGKPF